jgi:hypothetical protein
MLNSDTEILFPIRVIPELRDLRGEKWAKLIDRLTANGVGERDLAAFSMMMVRLCSCNGCNADSFRAMRGCTHCAIVTVRRYKYSDEELMDLYIAARHEVGEYLKKYK